MSLVERCWMITSKFSVIAILIITGICFGVFVYPYMKKKREAALVSIVYIGIMSVLYLIPQQIGNFSAYMLGVVAAFLVMYVQDRRNIYQKIFLAVTFFSIRWLAVAMAGRMDDFITKALVFGNTIAGRQWLQYGLYAGTRILDIVLCIVFLAVAIGLINKAYVYKNDEMSVKELVMLIIPSLVGVTGYGILQYYLNIYEKDTGKSLTDTYGLYGTLSFVHYFISIIAILVMTTSLMETAEIKPMVNQILLHISNTPLEIVEYCQKNGIAVEAYSPIAHGEILNQPQIKEMADKYGVSVPQLCIRYTLQLGAISLPKTGNPAHMKTNADVDFEISAEDMEVLKHFKKIESYGANSGFPVYGGRL